MRLDHLLSKENSIKLRFGRNIPRSDVWENVLRGNTLFNLEGTQETSDIKLVLTMGV